MKLCQGKIGKLLSEKHCDDIFVEQCKTGSSSGKYKIFDAWLCKSLGLGLILLDMK